MLIALTCPTHAFAQGQNGILTGIVADGDGVVPGATLTATDPTTGLVRTAVSNDRGIFRVLSVPAGRYTLKVEMEGFRQITLNEVVKGRDIFGMMKILPGVNDTTFSRDYAAWQSGREPGS